MRSPLTRAGFWLLACVLLGFASVATAVDGDEIAAATLAVGCIFALGFCHEVYIDEYRRSNTISKRDYDRD